MRSCRKKYEIRRWKNDKRRGEETLINLFSVPFQSSFSSLCVRMYLRRQYIHDACSLYFGKCSSSRRQFLQFINVYISAFNVTTRTLYDTDGDSEMNLSWCILNPPRLLLPRKGRMLYDVINLWHFAFSWQWANSKIKWILPNSVLKHLYQNINVMYI